MCDLDEATKSYFDNFNEIFPEMSQSLVGYVGLEKTIEILSYALYLRQFKRENDETN